MASRFRALGAREKPGRYLVQTGTLSRANRDVIVCTKCPPEPNSTGVANPNKSNKTKARNAAWLTPPAARMNDTNSRQSCLREREGARASE